MTLEFSQKMRDQTAQVCRQLGDDLESGGKKEEWREKRRGQGDDRKTGNREKERETLREARLCSLPWQPGR